MLAVKQRSNKFCLIQIKTTKDDIFSPYSYRLVMTKNRCLRALTGLQHSNFVSRYRFQDENMAHESSYYIFNHGNYNKI